MNPKETQTEKTKCSTSTKTEVSDNVSTSSLQEDLKSKIYLFKIKINHGHKVPIWRMVEVPATYSFYDLHVAIQDSMGWMDYHLHKFIIQNPVNNRMVHIGIPDDWMSKSIIPEKTAPIANFFSLSNKTCKYEYDFASPWNFLIALEKIIPIEPNVKYPRCVGGNCSSPPEDCPADPSDMSWVAKPFDYLNIEFRDPVEAWKDAFQGF